MKDLIEALQIMMKHGDVRSPCHCEHDEFHVYPKYMDFTADELSRLEELSFAINEFEEGFVSYRFGSR
jgi:hypothetical protein